MEFKEVKLGDISKDNKGCYGIGAAAIDFSDDLPTYLRITDISDDGKLIKSNLKSVSDPDYKKFILEANDIVFARTGNSTGRNYFYNPSDGELVYAGFLIKFSLDPKLIYPKFIKYYCRTNEYWGWVNSIATGSTRKNINEKMYRNMTIRVPSYDYQVEIVSLLEKLDIKIDLNNSIIANLEDQAQAIFKSWFIDFEPFQDGEFVESELGMIPEGWEVTKTGEKFNIVYGKNLPTKDLMNEGYPVFGGNGQIGFYNTYLYEKPKLLVSCRGAASGKVVISKPFSYITNNSLVFDENNNEYFYYFKELFKFIKFENYVTGSAQPQLTVSNSKDIQILVPDLNSVMRFNKVLDSMFDIQLKLKTQNQNLAELRDTLLPKLMSGEIRVGQESTEILENIEEIDAIEDI